MNNRRRLVAIVSSVCVWLACIVLTCAAPPAFAQGVRYNDVARTADNTPLSNGTVAVCSAQPTSPGNVGEPCSPLVTIYTDATLATSAPNPINADIHGNFSFWAPPGTYFIEFYSPARATVPFMQTITLGCVPNSVAVGCGTVQTQGNNTWTGTNIFNAPALFKSGDPWFDVKAFGAKCDDATDDTAAIQSALNAIPATGGVLYVPGVCMYTQTLAINTANVTIEGQGHFQFITQNSPVTYLDYQGTTGNGITVSQQGFKMRDVGLKYPTTSGGPLLAPPAPSLSQVAGSGCPAEAYFVEETYMSAQGQTNVSPEATITTSTGNCLQVASPATESGATGWNVFVSANSNNETKQTSSPLAIGTNWTFTGTLQNLGFRPATNTTAYSAVFSNTAAQFDSVKVFTNAANTAGTATMANGISIFGCCGKLHNVYAAGFGIGVLGSGSDNDFSVTDSFIQADNIGVFVVNGADINIERNDFEGNTVGNIKILYGSPYSIERNYFEIQGSNPPPYNVQVGDSAIPPQGFTPTPGAVKIESNFMQCNLTSFPPAPIVVETAASLDIEKNSFSQCQNQNVVQNLAPSTALIKILGNISDSTPLSWVTSTTGLLESDINGLSLTPGVPYFYGNPAMGLDSTAGASSLTFRNAGTNEWNINGSSSSLNVAFSGHTGENTLQIKPFGAQSFGSVQSNYAMTAAEVIVAQSGASATFDAGLGNTFELTLTGNVTSSTLVNVQAGQWLAFIICQGGSGGPWNFVWPANVFGGGIIGAVGGNCSTQTFYVSGSNAWAVGPMMTNLSTGLSGPSMLAASGTVPYFTGAWTNGDCLQAGGSPGLIAVTSGACGTGGGGASPGGTDTAVQFNNAGAFGGDAANFFYNSTTHALTLTGALTVPVNSFATNFLVNPSSSQMVLCGSSGAWGGCLPGVPGRSVSGTTDTIVQGDLNASVTYTNSGAVNVTLPVVSSLTANFSTLVVNNNTGSIVLTPTTSKIWNGTALATTLTMTAETWCALHTWDGSNYYPICGTNTSPNQSSSASVSTTGAVSPSGTTFLCFMNSQQALGSTESVAQWPAPKGFTISNLHVQLSAAEGATSTIAFTLRDGATSESITCTVGNNASSCTDLAHAFTVSVGDLLDWQVVQTGAATSAVIFISYVMQ